MTYRIGGIDTARALLRDYLETAEREMPHFPGREFASWSDVFRTHAGCREDRQHRLFMRARETAWPGRGA